MKRKRETDDVYDYDSKQRKRETDDVYDYDVKQILRNIELQARENGRSYNSSKKQLKRFYQDLKEAFDHDDYNKLGRLLKENREVPTNRYSFGLRWFRSKSDVKSNLLQLAIVSKSPKRIVITLLNEGIDPNFSDEEGYPAAHLAVRINDVEILKILFEHTNKINYTTKDRDENNLIHNAIRFKARDAFDFLMKRLKDNPDFDELLNQQNKHGQTPLHLAGSQSDPHFVKCLLDEKTIDVKKTDEQGKLAFQVAKSSQVTYFSKHAAIEECRNINTKEEEIESSTLAIESSADMTLIGQETSFHMEQDMEIEAILPIEDNMPEKLVAVSQEAQIIEATTSTSSAEIKTLDFPEKKEVGDDKSITSVTSDTSLDDPLITKKVFYDKSMKLLTQLHDRITKEIKEVQATTDNKIGLITVTLVTLNQELISVKESLNKSDELANLVSKLERSECTLNELHEEHRTSKNEINQRLNFFQTQLSEQQTQIKELSANLQRFMRNQRSNDYEKQNSRYQSNFHSKNINNGFGEEVEDQTKPGWY